MCSCPFLIVPFAPAVFQVHDRSPKPPPAENREFRVPKGRDAAHFSEKWLAKIAGRAKMAGDNTQNRWTGGNAAQFLNFPFRDIRRSKSWAGGGRAKILELEALSKKSVLEPFIESLQRSNESSYFKKRNSKFSVSGHGAVKVAGRGAGGRTIWS